MHAENAMLPRRLILIVIVMLSYELIMVLSPREYIAPMAQVVRYDGQPISPSLNNRLDVM